MGVLINRAARDARADAGVYTGALTSCCSSPLLIIQATASGKLVS